MSIEESLERIADSLEKLANKPKYTVLGAPDFPEEIVGKTVDSSAALEPEVTEPPGADSGECSSGAPDLPAGVGDGPTGALPAAAAGVDSAGFPWDTRIHASTKTRVQKTNEWKLKRGVDAALVEQVRTEQRAQGYGHHTATAVLENQAPATTEQTAPAATTTPAGPTATDTVTFPRFIELVTNAGYTPASLKPTLDKHGVAALPLLRDKPELMLQVGVELGVLDG